MKEGRQVRTKRAVISPEGTLAKQGEGGALAVFDTSERYRYVLRRVWQAPPSNRGTLLYVCLNPSVADERILDPTLTRCLKRAKVMNFSEMLVGNIFAWRDTSPEAMKRASDPVGPHNDQFLAWMHQRSDMTIVGWGSDGAHMSRGDKVFDLLRRVQPKKPLYALRVTKDQHPGHPLYLGYGEKPFVYQGRPKEE